ncbi:MAG: hypothetical protein AB1668_05975, partial [Nanoarchaeota archaeon]
KDKDKAEKLIRNMKEGTELRPNCQKREGEKVRDKTIQVAKSSLNNFWKNIFINTSLPFLHNIFF